MGVTFAVAAAGFLGAVSRYGLSIAVPDGGGAAFPWATLLINLSGSLLLGLLIGWSQRRPVPLIWKEAVGTGFMGAYTTFSSFNAQLWELARHHAYVSAAVYAAVSGIAGWQLARVGLAWGRGRRT